MADKNKPKDGLALIVGGLFVLALVFSAYNYFNRGDDGEITEEGTSTIEKIRDAITSGSTKDGDINDEASTDERDREENGEEEKSTDQDTLTESFEEWVPNNYNEGDIKGASYTVIRGDTLWEIAEGAYGNGAEWTKILEANKDSIGHLPNGQQALIVPGQSLVLP